MKNILFVLLLLLSTSLSFAQQKTLPSPTYKDVECFSERYDHERPLKIDGKVQYDEFGKYVMEKYYTFNHRIRGTVFLQLPSTSSTIERFFLSPINPTKEGSKSFSSIFVENKKWDPVEKKPVSDSSKYDITLGFKFFPDPDFVSNEKYDGTSYQAKLVFKPTLSSNIYSESTHDLYCKVILPSRPTEPKITAPGK